MKHQTRAFGLAGAMFCCVFVAEGHAFDMPEMVALKGNGRPLNWLAVSPDGTRVAGASVNVIIGTDGKVVTIPGEITVWDVGSGTKLSSFREARANFTYLEFSADGKSLLTVNNGFGQSEGLVKLIEKRSVGPLGSYEVWDVASGKRIGAPLSPSQSGVFTAVAISPDGRYLATVHNEKVAASHAAPAPAPPARGNIRRRLPAVPPLRGSAQDFKAREVTVWDMAGRKAAWQLPGVAHQGKVNWTDSLAFSPDGKRLALFLSGSDGPSSERNHARPDRPQDSVLSLKMLSLDAGQVAPRLLFQKAGRSLGSLVWSSRGPLFVDHGGRHFERLDPFSGEHMSMLFYVWPQGQPAAGGNRNSPVPPGLGSQRDPDGWFEPQVVMSADGTRLAALHYHDVRNRGVRENKVDVWDGGSTRVLGTVRPTEEHLEQHGGSGTPSGYFSIIQSTAIRIALAGNGSRLAISDIVGGVRVYELSRPPGVAAVQAARPAPGGGPARMDMDVTSIREEYLTTVARARKNLLAQFEGTVPAANNNASRKGARSTPSIDRLRAERAAFEKHGLIPWSQMMRNAVTDYLMQMGSARAKVLSYFTSSRIPDDLKTLIDQQVVARSKHFVQGQATPGTITYYANGRLDSPDSADTWSIVNDRLTLRWKNPQAPGGYWIDTCFVNVDAQGYTGANQNKDRINGTFLKGN